MTTTKKREPYFDNAKLILIFLVVLGHLIQPLSGRSALLEDVYYFLYFFHMPAFILISGFFSKNYDKPGYLKETTKKLLYPYVMFQFIYSLFYMAIDRQHEWSFNLLIPHWSLWFLLSLFCWNVLLYLFGKWHPAVGMTVALGLGLGVGYLKGIDDWLSLSRTLVFFPFFLLGFYLKPSFFSWLRQRAQKVWAAGLFVVFALLVHYSDAINKYWVFGSQPYDHFLENAEIGGLLRLAIYGASILLTFSFFVFVPNHEFRVTHWGRNTLYTYLLHGFLIKGLRATSFEDVASVQEVFLFVVLLSVIATALLSSPRFLRKIKIGLVTDFNSVIKKVKKLVNRHRHLLKL